MSKDMILLLADNLHDFMDERREFLEQAGYTVVTADNPVDAARILEHGGIDLAILDIRLVDDDDMEDKSGLLLAQKFGPRLPIILLTGYPVWEDVKAALGQDLNGLSKAVDFLSKEEGPGVMVEAVNLTLASPRLKQNVLAEFKAESSQALHQALNTAPPATTSVMFLSSLTRTERDLLQYRRKIIQQSRSYQRTAIWMGVIGMAVLVTGAILVFMDVIQLAVLSGVASVVLEAFSVLFINRAVQASKLVDRNYQELQEIYKASHMNSICDTIVDVNKRDDAKRLIIEKLTGKRIDKKK